MKTKRTILFRLGGIVLLLIIAAVMMYIGRGHTVYVDNTAMEYNGQTYTSPYKIVVFVDDKQIAKLYDTERGLSTCIGQRIDMTLEITQEKGGDEQRYNVSLALPYNMDGIVINLPTFLAGLPPEAYLSRFDPIPDAAASSEEAVVTDELVLGDI